LHQKAKTENEREKSRKFHGTMITGLTLRYHVLEKNDELQQKKSGRSIKQNMLFV